MDYRNSNRGTVDRKQISVQLTFAVFSLTAIVAAFFLANADIAFSTKTKFLAGIVLVFLSGCLITYFVHSRHGDADLENELTDKKLSALEDAQMFLGTSLSSLDAFRLVCNRINHIVQFDAAILLVQDTIHDQLEALHTYGLVSNQVDIVDGKVKGSLAARVFDTGRSAVGNSSSKVFETLLALPLKRNGSTFGVMQLMSVTSGTFDNTKPEIIEAISERISPFIASSLTFDKNISSTFLDAATGLANERAFQLVLENQLAEAQRRREDRPLTILTFDIKNFEQINARFGHGIGDNLLKFVATTVKDQLRQMDFLARSSNDEFLALFPTATADVVREVIGRIKMTLSVSSLQIDEKQTLTPEFNFGIATFIEDGETYETMLATARERRLQSKSNLAPRVVWFPKETVK